MLKKLMRSAVATAALLAATSAAQASVTVTIKQNGFGSGPIEVISENGTEWTTIRTSPLTLPVKVFAGISNSYGAEYSGAAYQIFQGGEFLKVNAGSNPVEGTHELAGSTANMNEIDKIGILGVCNAKLNIGDGINQDHAAIGAVTLRVLAYFDLHKFGLFQFDSSGADFEADEVSGKVSVPVRCIGVPPAEESTVAFSVTDIDLSLKTFSHATTQPNPGTVCTKGQLKVRSTASKAGPVKFKLWTKVGEAAMTTKVIDAWASEDGDGGYKAEHVEWVSVSKTSYVQAKAQEMVNDIELSTPWKDITLSCTNPGGGGVTADLPNDDDTLPPGQKLTGDFSFIDNGGTQCSRQGKALINFKTPDPQPVHFSLDCLHGHFSGVAQTAPHPGGGYVAPALVTFDIHQTTQAKCALKSVAPGTPKLHAFKGHLFQCVTRNIDPASGDFTNNPGADPATPSQPPIADNMPVGKPNVTGHPVRRVCSGGRMVTATSMPPQYFCKCDKAGWTAVKAGPVNWRCVDTSKRDTYKIDKAKADARRKALEAAKRRAAAAEAAKRRKAAEQAAKRRKAVEAARKAAEAAKRRQAAAEAAKRRKAVEAARKAAEAAKRRAAAAEAARRRAAPTRRRTR